MALGFLVLVLVGCEVDEPVPVDTGTPSTPTTPKPTPKPKPTTPPKTTPPTEGLQVTDLSWQHDEDYFGPFDVSWVQSEAATVRVEYQVDGEWESTPDIAGTTGANTATVIGVPLGTSSRYRVVDAEGTVRASGLSNLDARPVPSGLTRATITASVPQSWEPTGNYVLLSINESACWWCSGNYWLFIMDRDGELYWATRTTGGPRGILYTQISATGDSILWDEIVWNNHDASTAHRTWLDEPIEDIPIPGHHHAMVEHADGTIAWGATGSGTERLMELAPGAVAPTEIWRCADWPAALRCFGGASNSIWFDQATDTYVYSWWAMDAVVRIDRSTGTSLWWTPGESGGDMTLGLDGEYSFDPASARFRWQHGLEILANGNLLASSDESNVTKVREYEIDDAGEVLNEVWSHDPGIKAAYNGDTRRLPNGNTLHGLGAVSEIYEVMPDHTEVWRARFSAGRMIGRAELLEDLYDYVAPRD